MIEAKRQNMFVPQTKVKPGRVRAGHFLKFVDDYVGLGWKRKRDEYNHCDETDRYTLHGDDHKK